MEAGLELFGTAGYARTSIRAVSAAASLNSRYFYESFTSREDLLYAVYQRIVTDIFTRAAEAVAREHALEAQARAGLRAGWTAVTADRRKARIVAIEVVGVSERLERLRRETRHALAQLTADEGIKLAAGVPLRLDPVSSPVSSWAASSSSSPTGSTATWTPQPTRWSSTSPPCSPRRPTPPWRAPRPPPLAARPRR